LTQEVSLYGDSDGTAGRRVLGAPERPQILGLDVPEPASVASHDVSRRVLVTQSAPSRQGGAASQPTVKAIMSSISEIHYKTREYAYQGAFVMALSTRDKRMLSAVAKTMKLMIEPDASAVLGSVGRWSGGQGRRAVKFATGIGS
jgi:hypothetical protein